MPTPWLFGLLGGALIGGAAAILLLINGRVSGISGIFSGVLSPKRGDFAWRLVFVAGLIIGGALGFVFYPEAYHSTVERP